VLRPEHQPDDAHVTVRREWACAELVAESVGAFVPARTPGRKALAYADVRDTGQARLFAAKSWF
jgi:hypothetical protein